VNADTMAEWLRRQERRVFKSAGSYWAESAPRVYQAFPYHKLLNPDDNELKEMLRSRRAAGIRYSAPLNSAEGMISYHVVYSGKSYSLDQLSAKARNHVRKGLGNFQIEPISLARIASEGWELRHETLVRQGRTQAENKHWWEELCHSADGLPGVECWGAIDRNSGRLASSLFAFICDDCFCILYQQSRTEQLRRQANSALSYFVTETVLKRSEINEVFYGLHFLDAPASVDDYKFHLGFRAKPVRQRVVFHPWVAPLFNRVCLSTVRWLLQANPHHSALNKVEGMIRFSIEGKRALAEQQWPEVLTEQWHTLPRLPRSDI